MERIIRRFILFQGIAIGILTIIHSMVTIYEFIVDKDHFETWDYYSDIHGMREVMIPSELCWAMAAGALLFGIHRKDICLFYPIIFVAIGVLLVQLVREIVLFWSEEDLFWEFSLFCNPVLMFSMTCRRIHGTMTLIALKRLFESEQTGDNNFVRFNAANDACETIEDRSSSS